LEGFGTMPRKNYKSITIKVHLYEQLRQLAETENKSISALVEELLESFVEGVKLAEGN
jgi:predicted CopG family antitoxin